MNGHLVMSIAMIAKKMNNHKRLCKELYEHYKNNGICVKCGAAYALAGHVLCGGCMKKAEHAQKKYDPDGSKKRERMAILREERRAKGLCLVCGAKTDGVHMSCKSCLSKQRERELLRRIRQRVKRGD